MTGKNNPQEITHKPGKMLPAIWAGLLIGVLGGVPYLAMINVFGCIDVVAGGILSVVFYNKVTEASLALLYLAKALDNPKSLVGSEQ